MINPPTPAAGTSIYVSNDPGTVIPPAVINGYSAITVPAFYRAMNVIAANMAAFPRTVHQNGSRLDVAHPLDAILRRPNTYQNAFVFWRTFFHHAAAHGNGYARIERSPAGLATRLHNLLPEDVCPFRFDQEKGDGPEQFYYHEPEKTVYPGADVLHLQTLGYDGQAGLDPVYLMSETLQRSKALGRFQTRFLMKGTVLRGAIEVPGTMTPDQIAQLNDILRTYFRGTDAERDLLILPDGAKLSNATLSPQDSQIMQQCAFNTKEIAQITGVPPQFLFEFSESKYNNSIEQMGQDLVRNTFRPWIEQSEGELTVKLLSEQQQMAGFTIRLNPEALLRGDATTTSNIITAQVNAGIRTANEGRALLDLPTDPDPKSNQLRALGDTSPKPVAKDGAVPKESSAKSGTAYATMQPVIKAMATRIEAKTAKAMEAKAGKAPEERTIWANVFAEQQKTHAVESFAPVAEAIAGMDGAPFPVDEIASRYAQQVRQQAATGTSKPLLTIIEELTREKAPE